MKSSDQMMIEAQSKHISTLLKDVKQLQAQVHKYKQECETNRQAAQFYLEMQREIIKNPILQSEWDRFCSFLKMTDSQFSTFNNDESDEGWHIPFIAP